MPDLALWSSVHPTSFLHLTLYGSGTDQCSLLFQDSDISWFLAGISSWRAMTENSSEEKKGESRDVLSFSGVMSLVVAVSLPGLWLLLDKSCIVVASAASPQSPWTPSLLFLQPRLVLLFSCCQPLLSSLSPIWLFLFCHLCHQVPELNSFCWNTKKEFLFSWLDPDWLGPGSQMKKAYQGGRSN